MLSAIAEGEDEVAKKQRHVAEMSARQDMSEAKAQVTMDVPQERNSLVTSEAQKKSNAKDPVMMKRVPTPDAPRDMELERPCCRLSRKQSWRRGV